jgi:hypothetical protein
MLIARPTFLLPRSAVRGIVESEVRKILSMGGGASSANVPSAPVVGTPVAKGKPAGKAKMPKPTYGVLDVEDGNESSDFDDDNDAGAMPQFKKRASAAVASMFQLLNKVKKA